MPGRDLLCNLSRQANELLGVQSIARRFGQDTGAKFNNNPLALIRHRSGRKYRHGLTGMPARVLKILATSSQPA